MSSIQEFNYDIDIKQFIFWQYDESNVANLANQKNEALINIHTDFFNNWYEDVFNLNTANNFGISVWAIILDLPLVFEPAGPFTVGWGFGPSRKNFSNGNFAPVPSALSRLTLEQRRLILKLRYRQLTSRGTVTDVNNILNDIFGSLGLSYVRDNLNMTISYVFDFDVPSWILFIQSEFEILPTPAGVGYNILGRNVLADPIDFLVGWMAFDGTIVNSTTIDSGLIPNNSIVEYPGVMDFLIGKTGNILIEIRAKSSDPSAVFQFGYSAIGSSNQLSGDTLLSNEFQNFNFSAPLDVNATSYSPAIFNSTTALSTYTIEVEYMHINLIIG